MIRTVDKWFFRVIKKFPLNLSWQVRSNGEFLALNDIRVLSFIWREDYQYFFKRWNIIWTDKTIRSMSTIRNESLFHSSIKDRCDWHVVEDILSLSECRLHVVVTSSNTFNVSEEWRLLVSLSSICRGGSTNSHWSLSIASKININLIPNDFPLSLRLTRLKRKSLVSLSCLGFFFLLFKMIICDEEQRLSIDDD